MTIRRTLRILAKLFAGGLILLVLLIGPSAYFYLKWVVPSEELRPVDPTVGSYQAAESVSAAHSQANTEVLIEARNEAGMPSVSAAIGYDGRIQWAGVVGYANLEKEVPATLSSRYRLGSVSKALTAVLLARLLDENAIELDAKASEYVPDLPDHYREVTVRMLASHTAGVRHYSGMPAYWPPWNPINSAKEYASVEDGLRIFIDDDLLFAPGTGFSYSTYGYSLLSRLMEGATGSDFESLLQDELFQPATMLHTAVDAAGSTPERVSFYSTSRSKYVEAYPTNSSYKIAGGGILSTPMDVALLGQLLLGDDFISAEAKRLMWTPATLSDGTINYQNYGMGWRIDDSTELFGGDDPTVIIHHGGRQTGGVALFVLVPQFGISVAAFSNTTSGIARGSLQDVCFDLIRLAADYQL
jgi:CubicO group peptidase (beta-lactamase class C family)